MTGWRRFWLDLPLARKLFLTIGAIVSMTVLSTLLSVFLFVKIIHSYDRVMTAQHIWFWEMEYKNTIYARIHAVTAYIATGDPAYREQFEETAKRVAVLERSLEQATSGAEKAALADFFRDQRTFDFTLRNRVIPVYELGNFNDAWETLLTDVEEEARTLLARLETFSRKKETEIATLTEETAAYGREAVIATGVIWSIQLSVAVLVGMLLFRSIERPVARLRAATERYRRGEFEERLNLSRRDELGALADAFDVMGSRIQTLVEALRAANAYLAEESARAKAADRSKSEFLATISHELRTPLGGIIGFSEVLLGDDFGTLNEKQKTYVQRILSNGQHLLALINDLLDLSKVEAGAMVLNREQVRILDFFREALTVVEARAQKGGITLRFQHETRRESFCFDPLRMRQIMNNLLSNAVKFTPTGGTVTVRLRDGEDGALVVDVADTGIGIRPEALERIFLPFVQEDSALGRRYEGTGLGLSLTKRLVELHGGRIEVDSAPGAGSRFTVVIPEAPCEDGRSVHPLDVRSTLLSRPPGVILAGLEPPLADALRVRLEEEQISVIVVEDLTAAESAVRRSLPAKAVVVYGFDAPEGATEVLKRLSSAGGEIIAVTPAKLSLSAKAHLFRWAKAIVPPEREAVLRALQPYLKRDGVERSSAEALNLPDRHAADDRPISRRDRERWPDGS